jgi:hypothetical protein
MALVIAIVVPYHNTDDDRFASSFPRDIGRIKQLGRLRVAEHVFLNYGNPVVDRYLPFPS